MSPDAAKRRRPHFLFPIIRRRNRRGARYPDNWWRTESNNPLADRVSPVQLENGRDLRAGLRARLGRQAFSVGAATARERLFLSF